jgi:hypothetical protein
MASKRNSSYRAVFHLRRGGLHDWARKHGWKGKDSDPLPESLKKEAKNSDNPHVAKMGNFAENFGGK